MKSPDFGYVKASSLAQAIALLAKEAGEAKLVAGGQSLMATLNMRLSQPSVLVDIAHLPELSGIELRGDRLWIGAGVTHTAIEESSLVAQRAPMLAMAAPLIAHRAIRNRGTLGGSLAFADPAAEWCACLLALDGRVTVQGTTGQRVIAAQDFFVDLYTTALELDEIIVGVDMLTHHTGQWHGFEEICRRHGDYATAGLAIAVDIEQLNISRCTIACLGLGLTPQRAISTEALLQGQRLTHELILKAQAHLKAALNPIADLTHSEATKRHLASVLLGKMLTAALTRQNAVMV